MTTAMNEAEKLAELLLKSPGSGQVTGYLDDAAALLRRQAEQIKVLRELIDGVLKIGRGTSGRIILEGWHEETLRSALAATKEET